MVASKGTFLLLNLDYFVAYIKMFFFLEKLITYNHSEGITEWVVFNIEHSSI